MRVGFVYQYGAFLSYSRSVDGKLAPAIQDALQSYAKPWNQSRAMRVFRDDASLAANPGLWSSITAALDKSRYFILLASPEAARSPWVNREVEYWLEHRSIDQVMVVLTEGDLVWNDELGDFDRDLSDALPPVLFGRFREVPRWLDLRDIRSATHASLDSGAFADRIADLAAPLHGVDKDELVGAHVRQQRRTRRLVRTTIAVLTTMTLLAVAGAVVAVDRARAAQRGQELAYARDLAARARLQLDGDPAGAIVTTLASLSVAPTAEGRQAAAEIRHHLHGLMRFISFDPSGMLAFSADGTRLAVRRSQAIVETYKVLDAEKVDSSGLEGLVLALDDGLRRALIVSADHEVSVVDISTAENGAAPLFTTTAVVSADLSASGEVLAVLTEQGDLQTWDVNAGRLIHQRPAGDRSVVLSDDGRIAVTFGEADVLHVFDAFTGEPLAEHRLTGSITDDILWDMAVSGDGRRVIFRSGLRNNTAWLWNWSEEPAPRALTLPAWVSLGLNHGPVEISADGRVGVVATDTGRLVVWELESGPASAISDASASKVINVFAGHVGLVTAVALSSDGRYLASSGEDGTTRLWDLATGPWRVPGDEVTYRLQALAGAPTVLAFGESHIKAISTLTGEVAERPYPEATEDFVLDETGVLRAVLREGTVTAWPESGPAVEVPAPIDVLDDGGAIALSRDRRMLAIITDDDAIVWDLARGEQVTHIEWVTEECCIADVSLSSDGSVVGLQRGFTGGRVYFGPELSAFADLSGDCTGVRVRPDGKQLACWAEEGAVVRTYAGPDWSSPSRTLVAGSTPIDDVAYSPDSRFLAAQDDLHVMRVWDAETGDLILTVGRQNGVGPRFLAVQAMTFAPDSRSLYVLDGDLLWSLDVATDDPVGMLCGLLAGSSAQFTSRLYTDLGEEFDDWQRRGRLCNSW